MNHREHFFRNTWMLFLLEQNLSTVRQEADDSHSNIKHETSWRKDQNSRCLNNVAPISWNQSRVIDQNCLKGIWDENWILDRRPRKISKDKIRRKTHAWEINVAGKYLVGVHMVSPYQCNYTTSSNIVHYEKKKGKNNA